MSEAARENYERQQRQLRQQQGLPEEDGLEIDPEDFQVPEVNPEIYKDVEPLLFRGFLTVPATINGVPFVFKSLNHFEFEWLSMSHDVSSTRYHNEFLAYGVVSADNVNILKNREEHVPELADFFRVLTKQVRQKVVIYLSEINRRANRATLLVEPYVMENKSRLRWAQVRGLDLTSTAVTGLEGTQNLGLNWGQLTWRALNHLEDVRENAEREWENAKLVASAMAGKGMNKIYSADKRRRADAKTDLVERREKIIRFVLLNEPLEGAGETTGPVKVARTLPELTSQLERDLKGDQDWHDRVIAEHEAKIRADSENRMRQIHEARAAHLREFGDRPVIAGTDIAGLTKEEVQKRLAERRRVIAESLAARNRHPELTDPKYEEFSKKWLQQQPIVGKPPNVMTVRDPQPRPRVRPFRRD